jgi:3-methyl-2-oxobutanoate hydroxymethyltransferase
MNTKGINRLRSLKKQGEKIASLTAYDASFARLLDNAGIDMLLVGDSLGMVIQGQSSTIPVTMEAMKYHTQAVCRNLSDKLIISDMPFMSYHTTELALNNAAQLMQQGASMVKLEGGQHLTEIIQRLSIQGIPVCAHLGLLPQSVYKLGGYTVQGRSTEEALRIKNDALTLQQAGADILILECIPAQLAKEITQSLDIPVIGIGAGTECDGQILVLYDILNLSPHQPRFSQNFMTNGRDITGAIEAYISAVKSATFPAAEHIFS